MRSAEPRPLRLRELVAACVISALAGSALSVWAASHLAQRYHAALAHQIEDALRTASSARYRDGQYDTCVDVLSRSCSMQWGKPCVARVPKKPLFE